MTRALLRHSFSRFTAVLVFSAVASAQTPPEKVLLKDYKPRSIFKIPETRVERARYAVIDVHSDLDRLGAMLDRYPNLYADIGARYAELSSIPRAVSQFFRRYQKRLLYGTYMNPQPEMYRVTFRLLETADEHFYPPYFSKYHWPMHAFALPDEILKKNYRDNALKLSGKQR